MAKIPVDFTPPPNPYKATEEDKKRIWDIYERFGDHSGMYGQSERLGIEMDLMRPLAKLGLIYIVDGIIWRHYKRVLKEVDPMRELCSKGVEDLFKLKNRISRLYGQGRLAYEDFDRLNKKVLELEADLKEVKEVDG